MKIRLLLFVVSIAMLFNGCAKNQLLMKTYSPPKKQKEVKAMLAVGVSGDGYLNIELFDDTEYIINGVDKKAGGVVAEKLLADIRKFITQTNFISLSGVADESKVSLDFKILQLEYTETDNSIKGLIEVEFNIRKNKPLYTQSYKYKINRFSKSGKQALPNKGEILSDASKYLAKKLIKDISPIQTKKLVELTSLPSELEFTIQYAIGKNFKGAIDGMKKYKGKKTYEYYFNLAVYYEAFAAQEDDMALFAMANRNYELSFEQGGSLDEVVVKGKTKFDNFYEIIKKIAEQKVNNEKEKGNSMYEIL